MAVGSLLTATGMHLLRVGGPRVPGSLEAESYLSLRQDSRGFAFEDAENVPEPSNARPPDVHPRDLEEEGLPVSRPPRRAGIYRSARHDIRWNVNITAAEQEPVERHDISRPGAGGNQPCAEGGADILPGWVCVKRNRIERRPTITPEELMERYFRQAIPLILTDFTVKRWKVFTEDAWDPEKLKARYGSEMVNVQMGRESDPDFEVHQHLLRREIRFGEYVDMVVEGGQSNDYYLTANNYMLKRPEFEGMIGDMQPFFPGFMRQSDIGPGTYYWFGPMGTITPLHQDATSLFHVHIKGRKLWRMISPDQKELLYNTYGVYSEVDLLLPWDELIAKYPLMAKATIITEVVRPGEVLFVPNGWFHHVIALDHPVTSLSTTVWLPQFFPLEEHVHKRWNSLYRPDDADSKVSREEIQKGLTKFLQGALPMPKDQDEDLKTRISAAMASFKRAVAADQSVFQAERKRLYEMIASDSEVTGALLWVLAQKKHNRMPDSWKGWVMLNIARSPPLNTIIEVMRDEMLDPQDTWGVVSSWFGFIKEDSDLKIGRQVS
mmetsp:Transcript_43180/g.102463  ORF Transcript_43180/g.102463 Transcript_43180/m.102463 type:complete len:550 (+) Transcript_43180:178-1827(+)